MGQAAGAAARRPYVLLSAAVSMDGYLDDTSGTRLLLSNDADFDRVDQVRSEFDAILVGAGTVRCDDPALLVRSPARRERRLARGVPASPVKVTLTRGGDLDRGARFFTAGDGDAARLVYVPTLAVARISRRLSGVATVVGAGDPVELRSVLADLAARDVRRLLVEGGAAVLTQFLAAGLADELHLAIAPVLVGDPAAPRFGGGLPHGPAHRMFLAEVRQVGDVALLRYLPGRLRRRRNWVTTGPTQLTLMTMGDWWSIEVFHGEELLASRWKDSYSSSLIESAISFGATEWAWIEHRYGVVFEACFPSDDRWEVFRALPAVRAALDAVPDPVNGLLIYRGRGGGAGAGKPRRPRPTPAAGVMAIPEPEPERELDLTAVGAPAAPGRPLAPAPPVGPVGPVGPAATRRSGSW